MIEAAQEYYWITGWTVGYSHNLSLLMQCVLCFQFCGWCHGFTYNGSAAVIID